MAREKRVISNRMTATGNMPAQFDPMLYSIELHIEVQELAYRKARQRGFAPGFEEQDWMAAESEIGV